MFHKLNAVSLRRKSRIFIPEFKGYYNDTTVHPTVVAAVAQNVQALGYLLSPVLIERMRTFSDEQAVEFHDWLIAALRKELGGDKAYKPMYPNFPKQVANASDAELYINAIMHYCGDLFGMRIMPEYEVEQRPALVEKLRKLKPLGFIENPDVIFDELMGSKLSPSEQDKEDISLCLALGTPLTVTEIPTKETLAFATSKALHTKSMHLVLFMSLCKTSVDVLRVAAALSGGDVSLTEDTKFVSFKRPERKLLLSMINKIRTEQSAEDMMRWREKFKRLGERLHPGEFSKLYPNAFEAFRLIRNEGAETFNSKVEAALKGEFNGKIKGKTLKDLKAFRSVDQESLLTLLKSRPGDFARRLDHSLRVSKDKTLTLAAFAQVAKDVATPLLWQCYTHFNGREILVAQKERTFFPKGSTAHPLSTPNNLRSLGDTGVQAATIAIKALHERYAQMPKLGKVFMDPICEQLLVPMSNRSTQAMLRQAGRGSRFKLDPDKNTVRLFMYWKDLPGGNRVDLDLAAITFDKDWNFLGHCSWTQLRSEGMYHSGDITSAPKGASEFLDLNLSKLDKKVAYVAATVTSFTGCKFSDMDVAFAGWMSRSKPNSGEIYEPSSVEGRVDLRTPATVVAPLIVDVKAHEVIWGDMCLSTSGRGSYVGSSKDTMSLVGAAISKLAWMRPTIGAVVRAHVEARGGELVATREEADLIIAEDGHLSPFDVAKFASELL